MWGRPQSYCPLLSRAVDDDIDVARASLRVAVVLEEQFIAAGWPVGEKCGTVDEMAQCFGVGPRIVDEAVRVLTAHGTARLKRTASNLIGLEITAPEPNEVLDVLCGYAYLASVNETHRVEAIHFLEAVNRRLSCWPVDGHTTGAQEFLLHFLRDVLTPGVPPRGLLKERLHRFRAGQIVNRVMERHFAAGFHPGCRIGSEADLSALFHADRSITRQAIRLLESAGLVSTLPGRGNGIFAKRPPSAPVCRLLCCYLASRGLPIGAAFQIFEAMSIEAISLATRKADAEDLREVELALATHCRAERPAQLPDIFAIEDRQFDAIRNPLIGAFLRTMRGYVALTIASGGGSHMSREAAACFADNTRHVLDAMAHHDPEVAARAHERKLGVMRDLERRERPDLARILYAS
jgi:DNA-binding FadR family transcriptional regulator